MLKFTSIVGYKSCGDLRISRVFLTIFGQCINVLNYNYDYLHARRAWITETKFDGSYQRTKTNFKRIAKIYTFLLKFFNKPTIKTLLSTDFL